MRPRSPFSNAESSKKCNHNPAPTPRSSCGVDALCFFRIVKDRNSLGSKTKRQHTFDALALAKQALSQLSYTPGTLVGLVGFEPTTPALSRRCSNRLSYRPRGGSR